MSKIRLGLSYFKNTIVAGKLNKAGTMWHGEKHDVTDEALMCVVDYLKKDTMIYERDGKQYQLVEKEI